MMLKMIQYSILPVYYQEEASPYVEVEYAGHHVLAYQAEYGYILERVFSTDPKDFSDPQLTPGILLENSLIKKVNR